MSSTAAAEPLEIRRRLVEEAARILGEEGPSALSARRLASAAGTSTMALYTHFGGMSAVVDEVATEGFRRLIDHVDALGSTDDPLSDLRRMAEAYRDNALENRDLYAVMFGAVSVGALGGRGADPDVAAAAFGQLVSAVRRAMDAGDLREGDPAAVAVQFWSALHGYVMLELAGIRRVTQDPGHGLLWEMLSNLLKALSP